MEPILGPEESTQIDIICEILPWNIVDVAPSHTILSWVEGVGGVSFLELELRVDYWVEPVFIRVHSWPVEELRTLCAADISRASVGLRVCYPHLAEIFVGEIERVDPSVTRRVRYPALTKLERHFRGGLQVEEQHSCYFCLRRIGRRV